MIYRFDNYTIDTEQYQLSLQDKPVSVEPLVFDLLVYLIENRERVVSREELLDNLWQGKVVTDSALGARLKDVRKAVQDSGSKQVVIKTIHRRGYQFVAEIVEVGPESSPYSTNVEYSNLSDLPSIAVLPFRNLDNDAGNEYFADGITDDIITALSKLRNLLVIASELDFINKQKDADLRQVGRELGVRYLLEGSVRKSSDWVRVNVQLVDSTNGQHIWAERYDRELQDLFKVQDEIMREIVVALDVELLEGEQARAWSSGTNNFEAWAYVRHASHSAFYDVSPYTKEKAKQLLEKALKLDPDYATAWVMLGWIYQQYVDVASTAKDASGIDSALSNMQDCAKRALDVDPNFADALSLMAMYHLEVKAFDEAQEMAEKAISSAPNNAQALCEAGMVMNKTGHPGRGLELNRRVMRIWPRYRPGVLRGLALSYYLLGRFDDAIYAFEESITREPEYLSAYTGLAVIYSELGRDGDAQRVSTEILHLAPDFSVSVYVEGLSYKDPIILARINSGLLNAGLPE